MVFDGIGNMVGKRDGVASFVGHRPAAITSK
jgi:hypothetical protein